MYSTPKNSKQNSTDKISSSTSFETGSEDSLICIKLAPFLSFLSFLGVILCLFLSGSIGIEESVLLTFLLLVLAPIIKMIKTKINNNQEETNITLVSDETSSSYREVLDNIYAQQEENDSKPNIKNSNAKLATSPPEKSGLRGDRKLPSINKFKPKIREIEAPEPNKTEKKEKSSFGNFLQTKKKSKDSTPKKSPFLADITDDDDANIIQSTKNVQNAHKNRNACPKRFIPTIADIPDSSENEEKEKLRNVHKKKVQPIEKNSPVKEVKRSNKSKKDTYYYKINRDEKVLQIELDQDADVKKMKTEIAKINKVKNVANIKITFAGKDLTDDIVLHSLKVSDQVLFVYIRSEGDILLLTAKALKV